MSELERAILSFWLMPVVFFNESAKAVWRAERARQRKEMGMHDD